MLLTEYNEAEVHELFKEEGREEGRKEGREEGRILTMIDLVSEKLISISEAARRLNLSDQEFMNYMQNKPAKA